ncbi:MAG: 1-acyl-sn-glycerol-3-phosphate acyltransferase [Clostridia bacterium]|nr:1-acyl-sn-glycerol-3-phosphate acyltransferase [Clostridia bacterium]
MIFAFCYCIMWLITFLFYPTKVIGKKNLPKKKGYILSCNHYSNLDAIMLDTKLHKRINFLAKKELFEKKVPAFFLKKFGAIPIDREKPGIASFKQVVSVLHKNKIVGIFPEGTRNKNKEDDSLQSVKTGIITFASKAEVQIVPAVIYKRFKVWRRNYVIIGEPLNLLAEDPKRLSKEELEENTKRLTDAMNKLRADFDEKLKLKKAGNKKQIGKRQKKK